MASARVLGIQGDSPGAGHNVVHPKPQSQRFLSQRLRTVVCASVVNKPAQLINPRQGQELYERPRRVLQPLWNRTQTEILDVCRPELEFWQQLLPKLTLPPPRRPK